MPVSPGDKFGPYEIAEPIGRGGMGEVYKAHDPRTGRHVAIKISAERFSDRFDREVRAIAALNHRNICTLYDVGPNYLVMEFIDGPTLADRIKEGAIPLDESIALAHQIADALEAAHDKGITHRDLKPANIKIKPDGTIKVLDFGLAKLGSSGPTSTSPMDPENSPTLTMGMTQAGMIVGTAAYMAPEQARGKTVDKRADIWAFGVVFYEMVTGMRLFRGEDLADTLAAVVRDKADLSAAPARVRPLLEKCLQKDPAKRLRDISGVALLLDQPILEAPAPAVGRSFAVYALAALSLITLTGAIAISAIHFRETPAVPAELRRFEVTAPKGQTFFGNFALSPDGRNLAFIAQDANGVGHLWLRPMDSAEARQLADIDGAFAWSPDSRSIAGMAPGGKLVRVDISGGAPQVISSPGHVILVTWGRQDVLLLTTSNGLFSVPSMGGAPKLVDPKGHAASNPVFLPDGGRYIRNHRGGGLEVAALNATEPIKQLFKAPQTNVAFVPVRDQQTGYLLYMRGEALRARPFNTATLELGGDEVTLVNGVAVGGSGIGYFSVADDGTLAYRAGSRERVATLFDRRGKVLGVFPGINSVELAPDGKRFAAALQGGIWIVDMQKNTTQRFSDKGTNAVWSPDGQQLVFGKGKDLYIKPSNGAHDEQLLFESQENKEAVDWSRDGRYILFMVTNPNKPSELWYLDRTTGKAVPYLQSAGDVTRGQFSPDGKFVAYQSDESGQPEIYVRTFPAGEGRWLVSRGGGSTPRWRPDGKEIFFRGEQTSYRSVDVLLGAGVEIGQQHEWFNAEGASPDYDVMPDGNRFLVRTLASETLAGPITIVLNWPALLKK